MDPSESLPVTIPFADGRSVSGLLRRPAAAKVALVLAHGAGAGMTHPSMQALADGLAARSIATLRYQFPAMEYGGRRPDRPPVAHETVRAAVARAAELLPGLPLLAGGKSFGGRMTSQAQALAPLPGVRGLAFFGFPLHPAGQPSDTRADHLAEVMLPMLFLHGMRDALGEPELLAAVVRRLRPRATLVSFDGADHSFAVAGANRGRRSAEMLDTVLDAFVQWALPLAASDAAAMAGLFGELESDESFDWKDKADRDKAKHKAGRSRQR
ncbi:MAG: alpha/beta family hydrolase [Lautropia sp.]